MDAWCAHVHAVNMCAGANVHVGLIHRQPELEFHVTQAWPTMVSHSPGHMIGLEMACDPSLSDQGEPQDLELFVR